MATTMWLSPSLLPGRCGAHQTLHLDAQVIQLGSSYRQCSEVCPEPSIAMSISGNQGAVQRLADNKELIFLNQSGGLFQGACRFVADDKLAVVDELFCH